LLITSYLGNGSLDFFRIALYEFFIIVTCLFLQIQLEKTLLSSAQETPIDFSPVVNAKYKKCDSWIEEQEQWHFKPTCMDALHTKINCRMQVFRVNSC